MARSTDGEVKMMQPQLEPFGGPVEDMTSFLRPLVESASPPFEVRIGGQRLGPRSGTPRFVMEFPDPNTLARLLRDGDVAAFAEAYVDGAILVRGDLEAAVGLARRLREHLPTRPRGDARSGRAADERTKDDDARWVRSHYDLPTEFFQTFLDEDLVYSCGYFSGPGDSIEKAQRRKIELSCRKLQLRPGDELLDVGCGWGALLFHVNRRFGARAHGITLSEPQAEHVQRRARELGLEGRVSAAVQHYEDLGPHVFDAIVSIGMVEHVGIAQLPRYFEKLLGALKRGGLLLNHGITSPPVRATHIGGDFIKRRVFPGTELDPIGHTVGVMEQAGFEVLDVQALRQHYGLTLRRWSERYFAHRDRAAELVPERTLRTWDVYLPACAEAFESGFIGVHQVLAYKPDPSGRRRPPLTREAIMGAPSDLLETPS